ncbi:MAG: capsular biosynthesis protein [Pseudomonadota bacterium]|nr:capsular biosynthesis protein [Pseudomonadota bacterium]
MPKQPHNTRSPRRDEADFDWSRSERVNAAQAPGAIKAAPGNSIQSAGAAKSVPAQPVRNRIFLFLQGPPGTFFRDLGAEIEARGARVLRINFNGGDQRDWSGPATCYRGFQGNWTLFIDRFLRDRGVTDLVLFGDCRPMHMAAHQMARLRGIRVHVFEEGYIRPNWLTLERDGVNGHSSLPRDPATLLVAAEGLELPQPMPPIVARLGRRVRDTTRYFTHSLIGTITLRYPFYVSHRPGSIMVEGIGWVAKFATRKTAARRAETTLRQIAGQRYFLLPLQLSSDYQIRSHSPFSSMRQAADYVLGSFAAHAPPDSKLLIKAHPLDATLGGWGGYVKARARRLGLADRLVHIDGGDLRTLAESSLGVVVVNSTSATFALDRGVPVMALGSAVYAMPGITHQGCLDDFWTAPQAPDPAIYDAFRRVLHNRCLVRGGLASESATRILVRNAAERLLASA